MEENLSMCELVIGKFHIILQDYFVLYKRRHHILRHKKQHGFRDEIGTRVRYETKVF